MKCPYCGFQDTKVKDSRPTEDNATIRRRRACSDPKCERRFTTFERVQLRPITVLKSGGDKREPLDRDKMSRSMRIALRKRNVDNERIEQEVSRIVGEIERNYDSDVETRVIGELIMEALGELDQVAYIRYASVYRDFREASDFEDFVETLHGADE